MSPQPDEKLVSKLLLIGLAVVILAILVMQYNKYSQQVPQKQSYEKFSVAPPLFPVVSAPVTSEMPSSVVSAASASNNGVMPSDKMNETYKAVNYGPVAAPSMGAAWSNAGECAPRDTLTASDLLPKDAANSKWAQVAPAGQGDVTDQNFLTAGYLVGVNTIGQSKKNGNLQVRSDPPIEKVPVGPWQMSTIESSSQNHRTFEIGDC